MTPEHEPATENRFRQEAQEYLNALQDDLLDLFESTADRASFHRRLDGVLGHVRSLRGAIEKAEWRGMVKLSQRLEENLQRVRLSRPPLGLRLQNLWRQVLAALQAAIAVQEESPFADRVGVEATAAEALDRLELHFTEAPAGSNPWAELEHCLRLLASLRAGWQEVSEAQADLVAVQEALTEVGIAIPEVAAIRQWLEEAAASCQDLSQWQELGEQASQRLQEVLGQENPPTELSAWSSLSLLDDPGAPSDGEEPFEFPDFSETELFTREENAGTTDPFAWFEPAAKASTHFFWAESESEEEGAHSTPDPNPWGENPFPVPKESELEVEAGVQNEGTAIAPDTGAAATVGPLWGEESATVAEMAVESEPDFTAATTEAASPEGLEDWGFGEEPATVAETATEAASPEGLEDWGFEEEPATVAEMAAESEPDFTAGTTEAASPEGLEDWGFGEEPATVVETAAESEPDFTAATTEAASPEGLEDWGFEEESATVAEVAVESEPNCTAATTEAPSPEGLEDLTFWREAGYDAGLAAEMETMAEALAGLDAWLETAASTVDASSSEVPHSSQKAQEVENAEVSLDSLLTDLDAALPGMGELAAVSLESSAQPWEEAQSLSTGLSDGDVGDFLEDLEQVLAVGEPAIVSPAEFEALNFDLSDDVGDEPPRLPALDFGNRLSDLAATFDGEPPPLPKVQPVSRPLFSGPESVVLAPMESTPTALPSHSWSMQLLYEVAADLGAGQIVLNWQLQQLRTAVRSLLGHARNLGAPLEAAAETSLPNGVLPEELLRLREISEDIDLSLFEIEQANADRQRQIWQVQELAREERLCPLGSLGQQLVQGLTSVQLIVENSTVALERSFVNKLAEPLGDLLKLLTERSLEGPTERQRLGKPVVGTIRMRGVAVGDTLSLEITDDGAGLPFDIFQPMAPGATIAHRLQALGIGLRPDFTTGRGSRINLQLPYVLLMTRVLLLRIGSAMVAVRTEHVRDLLAIPPSDSRTVIWGHRTIPWLHPQDRIRINCRRQELPVFESPDQENVLVVLQSGDQAYGLAVQACWREQEATLQRLAGGMTLSFPFCGLAVLMDGRVIPLLAPGDLLTPSDDGNTQVRLLEKQKRQSARELLTRRSPQLILLVDDSINVRRYLASVLESAGFATVQARDGLEALEKLENGLQPGAIISDLEMPRMDGYTLLQRVRAREVSRHVPFVVLTSRTNERHRQQAEALGATAYINKPYRDEEMVSLMQRLTAPATDR